MERNGDYLSPAQAAAHEAKRGPRHPHRNTVINWMKVGIGGVRLEYMRIGVRYFTTVAWLDAFNAKLNGRKQTAKRNGITDREALRHLGV